MTHRVYALAAVSALLLAGLGRGFFEAHPSGVDITRAAEAFLATLSPEQRATTLLAYDTPQRLAWHFIPKAERKGLQIKAMSEAQRKAAHGLLRSVLSEIGYEKAVKIMALERILNELEKNRREGAIRDPERYFVTLFGSPGQTGRWGLSVEGHHLSLNFVVDHAKVVSSTPSFFGANPATVRSEIAGGLPTGTRVLAQEEQFAFDLVNSLSENQRRAAIIAEQAPRDIRAAGEPQPPRDLPVGLAAGEMDSPQRKIFRRLVEAYLENMLDDVRQARTEAIRQAGPDNVRFAWAGALKPGIGHYYRIQGPTFLIEFVNTQPDSAGNPANHIHCVWRDMAGDFAIGAAAN